MISRLKITWQYMSNHNNIQNIVLYIVSEKNYLPLCRDIGEVVVGTSGRENCDAIPHRQCWYDGCAISIFGIAYVSSRRKRNTWKRISITLAYLIQEFVMLIKKNKSLYIKKKINSRVCDLCARIYNYSTKYIVSYNYK